MIIPKVQRILSLSQSAVLGIFLGVPLLCALLVGCGGSGSLVKVTGKVLVDGVPADGAVLLFHPESTENTNVSSAMADENGVFSPVTGLSPGIPQGTYRVTVTWPDPAARNQSGAPQFGASDTRDPPDLLKGKYVSRDRTPLTVVITSSTVNLDPFELTK